MIDDEAIRSIEKLHKMMHEGVISEADFEQAKADLLSGRSRPQTKRQAGTTTIAEVGPYPEMPADQDFGGWLVYALRRYAVFSGRSCRREFWSFQIVLTVVFVLFIGLLANGSMVVAGMPFLALAGLAVPAIAVQVRRFHDQDKSGWFALLNLIPYLGPLIIAVFMMIDGTPGDNQYGPDPKDR